MGAVCLVAAAGVASAGVAWAGSAGAQGQLLISAPDLQLADVALLDVATGRVRPLPRSALAASYAKRADAWTAGRFAGPGSDLVRRDMQGGITFVNRDSLRASAGFDLGSLPGVRQPELYGPLKLSPDGRHLLAYWKKNYMQDAETLVVFDRQGRVVEEGSDLRYRASDASLACDWLPDGRMVHLAGDRIVLRRLGERRSVVAGRLILPPGASANGATLQASPDGQRLLISLNVQSRQANAEPARHQLPFVMNLDGSGLRPLVSMGAGLKLSTSTAAAWSPDGRSVAIVARARGAYAAAHFQPACGALGRVDAGGAALVLHGPEVPASALLAPLSGRPRLSCAPPAWV